jgi:hypothetical protein
MAHLTGRGVIGNRLGLSLRQEREVQLAEGRRRPRPFQVLRNVSLVLRNVSLVLRNVTFRSKFFAWVDIGYFRESSYNGKKMLSQIPEDLGQVGDPVCPVYVQCNGVRYQRGTLGPQEQVLMLDVSSLNRRTAGACRCTGRCL